MQLRTQAECMRPKPARCRMLVRFVIIIISDIDISLLTRPTGFYTEPGAAVARCWPSGVPEYIGACLH
jgi:hypothetical protein